MIEVDAVNTLAGSLSALSIEGVGKVTIVKRMIDGTDPNLTLGIFLYAWAPTDRPNIGGWEPALGRYRFYIQSFVKSSVREDGELWSMSLAKQIRSVLYRDADLRDALLSLNEGTPPAPRERALRFGVDQAEFQDAPITGGFAFFSQTTFWLETEVV